MSLSAAKGVVWSCTTPFAALRDVPPRFDNLFFHFYRRVPNRLLKNAAKAASNG